MNLFKIDDYVSIKNMSLIHFCFCYGNISNNSFHYQKLNSAAPIVTAIDVVSVIESSEITHSNNVSPEYPLASGEIAFLSTYILYPTATLIVSSLFIGMFDNLVRKSLLKAYVSVPVLLASLVVILERSRT